MTIADAVIDVERGKDDLGKAEKYKQAAMKKKFIFMAILVVLVTIVLLGKTFILDSYSGSLYIVLFLLLSLLNTFSDT